MQYFVSALPSIIQYDWLTVHVLHLLRHDDWAQYYNREYLFMVVVMVMRLQFIALFYREYIDYKLTATHILLFGGRLFVSWEDQPMRGNVEIILRGDHRTSEQYLPYGGPTVGAKAIGKYNATLLHWDCNLCWKVSSIRNVSPIKWNVPVINLWMFGVTYWVHRNFSLNIASPCFDHIVAKHSYRHYFNIWDSILCNEYLHQADMYIHQLVIIYDDVWCGVTIFRYIMFVFWYY